MTAPDNTGPDNAAPDNTGPADAYPSRTRSIVRVGTRSAAMLALVSVAGLAMFAWPLFATIEPTGARHTMDAPLLFMAIMPILILLVLAELSDGGMDTKALAILGVLAAINAALRPVLSAGTGGIEAVFFLLILAGRVFGPGFGFVLGCTSLLASAFLTAGVGPWLPFQMLIAAWIGMGAGLLPRRVGGKVEIAMLVGYGVVAAYVFGALMNLWMWPFLTSAEVGHYDGSLSFVPGAPLAENLHRFVIFAVVTTAGWDTGRALTNAVAILIVGPAVLATLRRAARRASFGASARFDG